jgi:hypothetical protein
MKILNLICFSYKNKLIVFGGGMWTQYTPHGLKGVEYYNDVYVLNTDNWTWFVLTLSLFIASDNQVFSKN